MQTCPRSLSRSFCRSSGAITPCVVTRSLSSGPAKSFTHCKAVASSEKHYAVVGAGLAGLATAYYLQKLAPAGQAVHVDVYDAVGIGAGGSGAAAGLLHPFTPKGKLLWKAHEAMSAALELLEAAEAAAAAAATASDQAHAICWQTGMIRPAANVKQSQDYWKAHGSSTQQRQQQQQTQQDSRADTATTPLEVTSSKAGLQGVLSASVVDSITAQQLVPGLITPITAAQSQQGSAGLDHPPELSKPHAQKRRQQQQKQQQKLEGWDPGTAAALHIPGGITLHPQRYMHALFAAAGLAAAGKGDGSRVSLHIKQLKSLQDLQPTVQSPQGDCQTADGPDDPGCESRSSSRGSSSSSTSCRASHDSNSSSRHQQVGGSLGGTDSTSQHGTDGSSSPKYDAVIVAAGAAVGSLEEFRDQQLPLDLCQGYTLDMVPPGFSSSSSSTSQTQTQVESSTPVASSTRTTVSIQQSGVGYGSGSPSILGSPYLASQGGQVLVVGATKSHGWTAQQAYQELERRLNPRMILKQQISQHAPEPDDQASLTVNQQLPVGRVVIQQQKQQGQGLAGAADVTEVSTAAVELLKGAAAVWPAVLDWHVGGIRTGVRAIPPRTQQGSVPLLGRWHMQQQVDEEDQERPPVWLNVGLGARGLVYHAWLGKLTAQAVLDNSEECIRRQAPELLAWMGAVSSGTGAAAAAMAEAE